MDFLRILNKITAMSWQHYTSFAIGIVEDLEENEMFWCEVMDYEMYETRIDVERVKDIEKYKLPEMFCYNY